MPDLIKYEVFLSHSTTDMVFAAKLVALLEQEEWEGRKLRVFYGPRDIRGGKPNIIEIEEALLASCVVVFLMTPDSLASPWVQDELSIFDDIMRSRGKDCLIPVMYKKCEPPPRIKRLCRINLTDPSKFDGKYQQLVAAIKEMLSEGCCPSPPTDDRPSISDSFISHPYIPRLRSTGFVPRYNDKQQDILELLKKELAPDKNQLVALWGPGGMGKTTLAIMLANQLYDAFSGRVIWVNARRHPTFSLSEMLDIIAGRLSRADLRAYSLEQKRKEISELVQDSRPLIVLDNFETIGPEEQRHCEEWLAENIFCPVLITTRERIESAFNIAVEKMTLAEARVFLSILIEQEKHRKSAFDGLDYDRIIEAAESNPLVIHWIVRQIIGAQNPEDVLHDLAQGEGDAAEHVFDRSFFLPQVGDDGRNILIALYLFAFKASRPALASVAGLDIKRFNKSVKTLSNLWLVETRENNKKFIVKGLTRERIKKHLDESGRADEFRRRFINYFLKYAEEHAQHTEEDFSALEDEKGNGTAAMDMAFRHQDWKSVVKFFFALKEFLDRHQYWNDLINISEQALIALQNVMQEGLVEQDDEFRELVNEIPEIIGIDHQNRELACKTYKEALSFYMKKLKGHLKEHGEGEMAERKIYVHQIGITSLQIGVLRQYEGKWRKARGKYRRAQRFLEQSGSRRGIGVIMNNLGVIAEHEGNIEEAADLYRQALNIFTRLEPPSSYAVITEKNLKRVET
ncbi:MAG TPA: TIR domain-containing protein [Pyrinomonadaceae bacterium]|jgi:tetratricopeptide (TPR) repeat protein